MLTGIELITQERKEQIEKHGFDVSIDADYNSNELTKAALFCIDPTNFEWPFHWDPKFRNKILNNDKIDRLKKAGAFIAAAIDREHYKEDQEVKEDQENS